jgi:ankyrin repeat protein
LIVKTLAENGVDKDEKNQYGRTALENAIQSNAKEIAAYLSGGEENAGSAAATGGMNLHQAVIKGDLEAITALLKSGADPNALLDGEPADDSRNYVGCTPLAVACSYKNTDAVTLLLQNGATPNYKNGNGQAAVTYLADTSALVSMQDVFKEKRIGKILQAMVDAGYEINETVNDDADTLITYALKYAGHVHINTFLLKAVLVNEALRYRPDINIANHSGETPLMLVCREDAREMENILLSLLESGAGVNLKDRNGNAALHYGANNASTNIAKSVCELLLEFKADPAIANNEGQTALDIAVATQNEPLVKVLLTHS